LTLPAALQKARSFHLAKESLSVGQKVKGQTETRHKVLILTKLVDKWKSFFALRMASERFLTCYSYSTRSSSIFIF